MGKKSVKISIRLEQELVERLIDASKNDDKINISKAARNAMEKGMRLNEKKERRMELQRLTFEINKIGVNINQIVKNNNSKFYSEGDKEKLGFLLYEIFEKLDNIKIEFIEEKENGNIKIIETERK